MKLRSVEAFCAAVEEKSISGAARRMYLSQSSVSERMTELEREAGVPLLRRSRQGVVLTDQGALFYEHARKVLDEVKALERTLRTLRARDEMSLRVGACLTLGEHLLPEWLHGFRDHMSEVVPTLFMGNNQEVLRAVRGGEMSMGIVADEGLHAPLESIPLLNDELVVVVVPGHPWTRRRIRAKDLPEEAFISRERESTTFSVVEQALRATGGVSLDVRMELASTTAIKEAIEAGLGFSILSRVAIRQELKAGILAVAEGFAIPRSFVVVRHPSTTLNTTERRFHEYLVNMGKHPESLAGLQSGIARRS